MPQDSMFPDQADLVGVRLSLVEATTTKGVRWVAQTETQRRHQDWTTLRMDRYRGLMTDCLPELGSEVLSAFLWGEGPHDVYQAAKANLRVANAHRQTYERNPNACRF